MRRFAATWPVRVGAGLILALLLGDVLFPAEARAGCGDHQTVYRVGAPLTEPFPSPVAPAPCTGPTCSRPEQPPLAPASVKVTLSELEAQLPDPPGEHASGEPGWLRGAESHRPVRNSTSVFHPPR